MAAARTLESRFEQMSVNDENGDGSRPYQKTKVGDRDATMAILTL